MAAVRQTEKIRMVASAMVAAKPILRTTPESTIIGPWLHTRTVGQEYANDRDHQRIGGNEDSHCNHEGTRDFSPQVGPNRVDADLQLGLNRIDPGLQHCDSSLEAFHGHKLIDGLPHDPPDGIGMFELDARRLPGE